MLIDARTLPRDTTIETDVCIIGAGAAGITLALEFREQPFKVCLLESGDFEIDDKTQSLYDGVNVGNDYYPLDIARLRYFGGTTNHWEGACIPLEEIDFQVREWVPYSGWPISRSDLVPYYRRAQALCEIGPFDYKPETWESNDKPQEKLASDRLVNAILQSGPPTRFGEKYRKQVLDAKNIDTYLNANVLEIEASEHAQSITRLRVSSLEKNPFFVNARIYILATGAIENPRLLLLSNSVQKTGLGNQSDLVGRFFMEHPVTETGFVLPTHFKYRFYGYYGRHYKDGNREGEVKISGYLMPSAQTMQENALLHGAFGLNRVEWKNISKGVASMRTIIDDIKEGEIPDDFLDHLGNVVSDIDDVAVVTYRKLTGKQHSILRLSYWSEQSPNPESRVSLHSELDAFGQNKVQLDWRLNEQDRRSVTRLHEILAEELGRAGLGRLRIDVDIEAEDWMSSFRGSYHHMGTTRMHDDPRQGVVDASCRLHGISNLFIAGSSIFPTSGHANPTLTIVALSLRLAEHIKRVFA